MRINSYNKFFEEVAKIMNTSVTAVKQLECRYKVELANHVYFYVFRGVAGGMFIHDHRGIEHITSCYNFEDFKTLKDLYDRLVSDYSESDYSESDKKEVMEVKQELNACFGKEQYFDTDCEKTSLPCLTCKHFCVRCDNERIKMTHCVRKNTENYLKAAKNPNWHHVSLATIDFDMLDKKRQVYLKVYRELKRTLSDLSKCKSVHTYEVRARKFIRYVLPLYDGNEISFEMRTYLDLQLSMQNVESCVWSSSWEAATGYHESRRYNKCRARR